MWSEQLTTGHAYARSDLKAAWEAERLPHALLFTGEAGIGKADLALWLVCLRWCQADEGPCGVCPSCKKVLTGNHPDFELVRRDPPAETDPRGLGSRLEITVAQVREGLIPGLSLAAVEGGGRSVLIRSAEDLNEQAQNALLKTLEEPPSGTLLLLVTAREDALLDTIRSRCQEVRLWPLSPAEMTVATPHEDPLLLGLARGRPGRLNALRALDVGALLQAFDGLLARPVAGTAFGTLLEELIEAASTEEGDVEQLTLHQIVLEALHARIRDLALLGDGGAPDDLITGAVPLTAAEPLPMDVLHGLEAAIFEAGHDLRRHLPPAVAWAALGCEFVSVLVGGSAP
ncbi:MAG: DNA polymerase III delta' subunit [Pseudohongiellaceae bacterium]|jgi:DNA polymerase III delta' subunit